VSTTIRKSLIWQIDEASSEAIREAMLELKHLGEK
jgi:hypothetical protein